MPKLSIVHRTTYQYRTYVQLLPHRLMLRPRESRDLKLLSHQVTFSPEAEVTWSTDVFGNDIATARFVENADLLTIESTAQVELGAPAWPVFKIDASALSYPFLYADEDWRDLGALTDQHYPDDSAKVVQWARSFIAAAPTDTLSLLKDLNLGVHNQIRYESRDDEGTQTPEHTLSRGWGSCRDLAVLLVEGARALGFGARVVSGYLWPNDVGTVGAGATHAWGDIFVPGPGWIAFDPTNGTMGGANLIPTTVARGIAQTVPVSGSYVGPKDAFERMEVQVDVRSRDVSGGGGQEPPATTEIYASSNGDRWLLIQDQDHAIVRHEPTPSSGGKASKMDVDAFLSSQGKTPQGESLFRMIGSGILGRSS
ncbi:transglutaminase family protein [Falsirhodobacter sp. 1013]|uniref:transglutaminase family protein n=1 Tax=Falsirhodobacter sp. 1013 TaxID=3417566 RepID=UPI003EB82846